jgi:hypothetical protein
MLWSPKISVTCLFIPKRGKLRQPVLFNPGETNQEQEGDVPHCPDRQNTNAGKDEKERDHEKNGRGARPLTVVIGAGVVMLTIHGDEGQ